MMNFNIFNQPKTNDITPQPDEEDDDWKRPAPRSYPVNASYTLGSAAPLLISFPLIAAGITGFACCSASGTLHHFDNLPLILFPVLIIAGGILCLFGIFRLKFIYRFYKYIEQTGLMSTSVHIEKLADAVGRSVPDVEKDLRRIIQNDYLPEGHIDSDRHILYLTHDAWNAGKKQEDTAVS